MLDISVQESQKQRVTDDTYGTETENKTGQHTIFQVFPEPYEL